VQEHSPLAAGSSWQLSSLELLLWLVGAAT